MLNFAITNIANKGREIYLFHRVGKDLKIFKDISFFPYFYSLNLEGAFQTIDNKRVKKIVCSKPYDIAKRRNENSYESDIPFPKRYLIDKIDKILPCEPRYSFIDIEVMSKSLPTYQNPIQPISCISCSDSYTNEIKTFYLDDADNDQGEEYLLESFVKWIREKQFDFLTGWNFIQFDWLYLSARYKHIFGTELADDLSPLFSSRPMGMKEEKFLIPTGLGIVDYLGWFKKIYKGRQSYALDSIAQEELKEIAYEKIDFSIISEKLKEKNINDVRRLIDIEKKLKIVDYYNQLRIMSKADWMDLEWNSKILDMMLLSEAKAKGIVLPSKKYVQEEVDNSFEGAYRHCETGLFKNLYELDISSAYPSMITNFCLDIANIRTNEGIEINGTKFAQNTNALLPSLIKKLLNKKDDLSNQLKIAKKDSEEEKNLENKYAAIKAVVNSAFGVTALQVFRLFDIRIASSITFLVRDLLHYIEKEFENRNIKVIYTDTDGLMIESKDNPSDLANQLVKQWAKEKYNKEINNIEFKNKGIYERVFIIALCHYIGELRTSKGLEKIIRGVEAKRADSSKFMKSFQEELIDKILKEESKEAIEQFIASQKETIKILPLSQVGFPVKYNKEEKDYSSPPIFLRAMKYTQSLIKFEKNLGDSFYYIPVQSFGTDIRKSCRNRKNKETGEIEFQKSSKEVDKDVLAFDDNKQDHIAEINWDKVIEKSIDNKVEKIFKALKWEYNDK